MGGPDVSPPFFTVNLTRGGQVRRRLTAGPPVKLLPYQQVVGRSWLRGSPPLTWLKW